MKKLTIREVQQINREYSDVINPIVVEDFESACERCKQLLSDNYKKEVAELAVKQRMKSTRQHNYCIQYSEEVISGKRNPPSAKHTREFLAKMKKKHGGIKKYNLMRIMKGVQEG